MARDIRVMNFTAGQQIESDEVMKRLGELEYRNHGSHAQIGLFDTGKALITSGLRVEAVTGLTVKVTAGNLFQRETYIGGCIQTTDISVTIDAASGAPRTDIVEGQIITAASKTDYARIGTVATGTEAGSLILTNEEIQRDVRYYFTARKKTNSTDPTAATAGTLTGTVAIPGTIDLSEKYLIHLSDGEDGNWIEIDCRGTTPNATTRAEIINAINAAVGRTMASAGSGDVIVLTGNGTGISSHFAIKPPVTDPEVDALEEIFGVSAGGVYKYDYSGTNGWIKLAEIDMGASTTTITTALIRNIEQKDTWASETDEVIVREPIYALNEPDWNEWSSVREYDTGDIAYVGDTQFVSLTDSNQNNDPLFSVLNWMPCPSPREVLAMFQKAEPVNPGMHRISDARDGTNYKQFFDFGTYKLGSRTFKAYGVRLDGTQITGDTDLEGIFDPGGSDEYPYIDLFAPDVVGVRTLRNYKGRVARAITSTSGGTGDSLAMALEQEDQMQQITGAFYSGAAVGGAAATAGTIASPSGAFTGLSGPIQGFTGAGSGSGGFRGVTFDSSTSSGARTGLETRMKNYTVGVPFIVVIKEL